MTLRCPSKLATELKTHYKFSLSQTSSNNERGGKERKVCHRRCHVVQEGGKRARKLSRNKAASSEPSGEKHSQLTPGEGENEGTKLARFVPRRGDAAATAAAKKNEQKLN